MEYCSNKQVSNEDHENSKMLKESPGKVDATILIQVDLGQEHSNCTINVFHTERTIFTLNTL